jgi:hypothetical protein
VQGTTRAQYAKKLPGDIPVAEQMFQNFEADYFIERSGLAGKIIEILLLEAQA